MILDIRISVVTGRRLRRRRWIVSPETGFYTTVAKVDFALEFLAEARSEKKPWFLYLSFNAPHAPLQPLKEDYEKYKGRYEVGWDAIRTARVAKQKALGWFGQDVEPSAHDGAGGHDRPHRPGAGAAGG